MPRLPRSKKSKRLPPIDRRPGRVDVGGRKLKMYCLGKGSPAAIVDAALKMLPLIQEHSA